MVWVILFLMSFLSVPDNACGDKNRKRDLKNREATVIYATPVSTFTLKENDVTQHIEGP